MATYENQNGERILPMKRAGTGSSKGLLLDKDWIRRSFLVDAKDLDKDFLEARTNTTAKFKYVTSGPGGNLVINPLPQPCIYTDPPPIKDQLSQSMYSYDALGSFHSEIFDDNMHVIHMRFGVPAFNSLWRFLNGMYDFNAGKYARTGRGMGLIYNIVRTGTSIIGTLLFWPIQGLGLIDKAARFFMNKPSSRFYYMKPTMPMYWDTVQTIVNHLAANRGIIFYDSRFTNSSARNQDDYTLKADELRTMHGMFPDIIDDNGSIDVFAMANRAQRAWRKHLDILIAKGLQSPDSVGTSLRSVYSDLVGGSFGSTANQPKFYQYFQKWVQNPTSQVHDASNMFSELDQVGDPNSYGITGIGSFLEAEASDGGQWVSFRVTHGGPVGESFSNDFKQSNLGEKINSMSASSRDARFDMANGNIGDGMLANIAESIGGVVADASKAFLDSVNLQGLAILGGAAFADFPQYWDRSSANLPGMSYSVELISPANDPMAQLINIYVPLAMLLAAALPRSSGKQSHVDPFLCELYDRGRAQTRLGMFRSLTISRGDGNIGWDSQGHYLQVKVNFEIADMGGICTLPVSEAVSWSDTLLSTATGVIAGTAAAGPAGGIIGGAVGAAGSTLTRGLFDDDSYFNDYMAILSGLGMASQIHRLDKLRRRLTVNLANSGRLVSKARTAAYVIDSNIGGQLATAFFYGNARMH